MLISIILGAVSGGVAGLLATILTTRFPTAKRFHTPIFIVLLVALYLLANTTLGPLLRR